MEDEKPSFGCTAYGCPVPAGITKDGKRYCCVHVGMDDFGDFAESVRKIRSRMELVEAIRVLRNPELLKNAGADPDGKAVAAALQTCPEINVERQNRYSVLLAFEAALIDLAQPEGAKSVRPPSLNDAIRASIKRVPA